MHMQTQASASEYTITDCSRSLTPTFSDWEEEAEQGDPDLSDYYSDSGYPTLRRPVLVLFSSAGPQRKPSSCNSRQQSPASVDVNLQKERTSERSDFSRKPHSSRVRKNKELFSSSATLPGSVDSSRAFRKLRKSHFSLAAYISDRERPPSSLVTTSISANGGAGLCTDKLADSYPPPSLSRLSQKIKQLRSLSLPFDVAEDEKMAQAKLRKAKRAARTLSFSFGSGSGDKRRRALNFFGSLNRRSGEELLQASAPNTAPSSPILVSKRIGAETGTIYEEETSSLSSAEEERLNELNYLHGDKFGSCRELSSTGLESETLQLERDAAHSGLRPLSKSKHKRPSLPNFTKFQRTLREPNTNGPSAVSNTTSLQENGACGRPSAHMRPLSLCTGSSQEISRLLPEQRALSPLVDCTPTSSPSSSPLHPRKRRYRKLSDPGSAPSTPDASSALASEPREERGLVRGGRGLRKGFTFCVSGDNLSPDWVG